ncbi:amidase family protein [Thalassococcus sp. S3]|uniref:amidase family protein n=1 Tax=Thalassococcus sp. S3 TaxID=2017482 RepID=UPI0013EEDD8C|nr:amidase family protein [Thalassococcus sp. S3]
MVREPIEIKGRDGGLLKDVPVVVKANIAIKDLPLCGASPAMADHVADQSATTVRRLLDAGAVIVGQANLHELAFGITSHNAHHGPVGNPAAPGHMAGGSSGGTAAAIASRAVPMGLGTDTGGSGRLPAAMCGCVGFRPTHGRYPPDGVLTLSDSFDTVTPMALSVDDIRRMDAVLAGQAPSADPPPSERVRLGLVDSLWSGVDDGMAEICKARLARLPVEIVPLEAPDLVEACTEIAMGIVLFETQLFWSGILNDRGQTFAEFAKDIASPDVAGVFQALADGAAPPRAAYEDMVGPKRQVLRNALSALLKDVDALVMPSLPAPAPPIDQIENIRINGNDVDLFSAMTRRALVASVTGHPSITLPAGNLDGLPYGLELTGHAGEDTALLSIAARVEEMLRDIQ